MLSIRSIAAFGFRIYLLTNREAASQYTKEQQRCPLNRSMELTESKIAESWKIVNEYHERTKHRFHRYARSLGYMDWSSQPDPFRRFLGAQLIPLAIPQITNSPSLEQIYRGNEIACRELSAETISEFLYYSLSLSAWKQSGTSQWALRVNPSSGNLHPTEGYLLVPPTPALCEQAALFHYAPKEHGLELRAKGEGSAQRPGRALTPKSFLIGLTSIHWRESWKYGERAFRYCQHDVGHAFAALRLSAAMLGWRLQMLSSIGDDQIRTLLGLDRQVEFHAEEREEPELLAIVSTSDGVTDLEEELTQLLAADFTRWFGHANLLSERHHEWPIIDRVSVACHFDGQLKQPLSAGSAPNVIAPASRQFSSPGTSAAKIIRQRRSAVDMDGQTAISSAAFFAMLEKVMPNLTPTPWDAIDWRPLVHLGIFVHRIIGLEPGLYFLVRDPNREAFCKSSLADEIDWQKLDGVPSRLPLFLLRKGDARSISKQVSCDQDIAADGAFSLGMFAEFEPLMATGGPHWYRRLFWETGMIGQVLYLEAEAAGIAATGIGCFFDDAVHEVFGVKSRQLQSLYHFTVGGPVHDSRISSLPAYAPSR